MKPVKALCVADEIDLLVYSAGIRERFGDVDLILSAGDLPDEYLGYITSMLNRPIVSVAGNHDPDHRAQAPAGVSDFMDSQIRGRGTGRIAFKVRREAGVRILGLPGSIRYNFGPNQYSDLAMAFRVAALVPGLLLRRLLTGRGVDVILAHSPPRGIHDASDPPHRGFTSYLWLIRLAAPEYFLHGHIHLYDLHTLREEKMGRTTIVNVYGHRVIEIGGSRNE